MLRLYMNAVLISVLCCTCALSDLQKRQIPNRYCGRYLVSALSLVCDGRYNGLPENKRGAEVTLDDLMQVPGDEWMQQGVPDEMFPFRPLSASTLLTNTRFRRPRRHGGIVDECCNNKGCTINELRTYCSTPAP
ncbi:LIRP-like [Periplaneta americana]|uniref:LIRP-like n=1 Tax=Periplaneta americana TaxID=6978 RepID=UPI0037E747DB